MPLFKKTTRGFVHEHEPRGLAGILLTIAWLTLPNLMFTALAINMICLQTLLGDSPRDLFLIHLLSISVS